MAVRVIGSWYYTSELPADEAQTLRAAMVSYKLVALRALCAGDTPRARWAGGDGLLKNLFAAELPEELFRKVITFWAPVWK